MRLEDPDRESNIVLAGILKSLYNTAGGNMNLEIWLAFVMASSIVLIVPGPTIILVVSQAVTSGRSSVVPLVLGVVAGIFRP